MNKSCQKCLWGLSFAISISHANVGFAQDTETFEIKDLEQIEETQASEKMSTSAKIGVVSAVVGATAAVHGARAETRAQKILEMHDELNKTHRLINLRASFLEVSMLSAEIEARTQGKTLSTLSVHEQTQLTAVFEANRERIKELKHSAILKDLKLRSAEDIERYLENTQNLSLSYLDADQKNEAIKKFVSEKKSALAMAKGEADLTLRAPLKKGVPYRTFGAETKRDKIVQNLFGADRTKVAGIASAAVGLTMLYPAFKSPTEKQRTEAAYVEDQNILNDERLRH